MLTLTVLTILLFTLAATATAAITARPLPERIARTITATWTCQDAIGVPRTRAGNVWQEHSPGYRQWQLRVWQARLKTCLETRSVLSTLKRGLANTPMAGTEAALEAAGRRYRISP